ncbi:hypothetical protein, partial [Acinetobacter baumannii]|uniref:hypothetical protein n=1 Tax=Acinetobacter baumannii TaxID=470 RepID=UPI0038B4CC80
MKKSVFTISILIIGLVLLFLFFTILGILYFYWGDAKAVQDSLSTTGSIFGALATLAAASIAAYLFNDWKEQHNKQVTNHLALQAFDEFSNIEKNTLEFATYISDLEILIGSYECELDYDALRNDGSLIYIQNIVNKKAELNINFLSLLSKIRTYLHVKDPYINFDERYSFYHSNFVSINNYELDSTNLRDDLNEWESNLIGYR